MATAPALSSTKENTNYARVSRLLIDGGTQAVRKVFDTFYPPATLHAELSKQTVHNILKLLYNKKILNPTQWGNLFPAIPTSVTSANFDITLLFALLRNICPLTPPRSGWNNMPAVGDVSTEGDLVRIRLYRNDVYAHVSSTPITDADFKTYWSEISQAVVRLGGKDFKAAITKFEHESMDPDFEEHYVALLKQWCENESSVSEKLNDLSVQLKNLASHLETKVVCNEGTQTEGDPSMAVKHLAEYYSRKASWIQPLPWCSTFQQPLEQVYTKLQIISREKTSSQLTDKSVGMYEIFKATPHNRNPRKVLIEGSPGIGKTTYCQKIAYDWATGNLSAQESFPQFRQVIFLKCQDFESEDNLWSVVEKQLLPNDIDGAVKVSFAEQVQKDQNATLIILDGIDEVNRNLMDPISQLITGKLLSRCHLIVTARHEVGVEVRKDFDTLLEITGYTLEDVQEYIKKYFQEKSNTASQLIKEVEESVELSEIARNPMNTALICVLFEELEERLPRTRTQLYHMITECLLKRHASRQIKKTRRADDITLVYRDDLINLGKLAVEAMQKDRLYFDETEILGLEDVVNLGFLSKETSGSKINPICRYVFLHKSFQEYLAAFYLTEQLKSHTLDFEEILLHVHVSAKVDTLWQVIVFLAGMLSIVLANYSTQEAFYST